MVALVGVLTAACDDGGEGVGADASLLGRRDAGSRDAGGGAEDAGDADSGSAAEDGGTAMDGGTFDAGTDAGRAPDGGIELPPLPDPLGPLPMHEAAEHDRFQTRDSCTSCHSSDGTALTDEDGRDVSMSTLWRASMMSFAGRDPYFLAAFSHELEEHPAAAEVIEATCTRCHAPAGHEGLRPSGAHISFEDLTTGTDPVDHVARDGVTCTACHQIDPANLGTPESFSGGWLIDDSRRIYGPHNDPFQTNMINATGYTPVYSMHMRDSAQCATCHTLFTQALDESGAVVGPTFPEQTPFLEWRNSDYRIDGDELGPRAASCQSCHVPTVDEDGDPIRAPISTRPGWLGSRSPIGRHVFVGANAYMLDVIADQRAWIGTPVSEAEIRERADLTERNLRTAAALEVETHREDGALVIDVEVENLTGHKLPTAYPSRRAWLQVEVLDAGGAVLWASGRTDASGALVDQAGRRLDWADALLPHLDEITREDQVQVYESVMGDASGAPTSVLLAATQYVKDDRLLPHGWEADDEDAEWTAPVGVEGDDDFVAGSDEVTYRLPALAGAARVRVRFLYQSVPPAAVEGLRDHPTPATARFVDMTTTRPPAPELLAEAEQPL